MKKVSILLLIGLCGCAINSGIVPLGKDSYMVSRQAATGFTGSGNLKTKALKEANKFCEDQGKKMQVISISETKPPYVFANFPKAEVQFMCLDANDPRLQYKRIEETPDVVIKRDDNIKADISVNNKEENNKSNDLYSEFIKLEDLRAKKILTENEFQAQKKLLLDRQK